MSARIEGRALVHAQPRRYTDGTYAVLVLIEMPGGTPVLAERAFGTGPAASFAASNAAQSMRKGVHVVAYGKALRAARHDHMPVLRLEAVDQIVHPTANHIEPAASAA